MTSSRYSSSSIFTNSYCGRPEGVFALGLGGNFEPSFLEIRWIQIREVSSECIRLSSDQVIKSREQYRLRGFTTNSLLPFVRPRYVYTKGTFTWIFRRRAAPHLRRGPLCDGAVHSFSSALTYSRSSSILTNYVKMTAGIQTCK